MPGFIENIMYRNNRCQEWDNASWQSKLIFFTPQFVSEHYHEPVYKNNLVKQKPVFTLSI